MEQTAIADYLNRPDVRKLLSVEIQGNFTGCSMDVNAGFNARLDKFAMPSHYYVAGLLDRGIPILIYAGTYDWQCNWVANKLWVDKLEWSGMDEYNAEAWRDWQVEGRKAGETKSVGLLTFATLRGAGHMGTSASFLSITLHTKVLTYVYLPPSTVPHDKPAESFAMVSRWLSGKQL